MDNQKERSQEELPKEDQNSSQVKNDVQHPQKNESQQVTGGSTGPGNNYDQEIKPNTGGSTQTGSYATDNRPDIKVDSSDDLENKGD